MDTVRAHRVQEIFQAALNLPDQDRQRVIQEKCGPDDELRAEVESLLAVDERAPQDFMRPPGTPSDGRYDRLADHAVDWAGRKIGRYSIHQLIAAGGMGSVYLAEQESPRREVALKVLHAGMTSRTILRRFEFETHVLARLHHPHIAQIYESGVHEDRLPWFAMEHIPGALPLTVYAGDHHLDLPNRLRMFLQVCDAVEHGHQRGVVHRDLKPGNILVDANGHAKVIDFGVARSTDADVVVTTMHTDAGQIIGTLQYMSPEQCAADAQEIDTRTDVYSLGVVLFELVSGKLPYDVSHVTLQTAARIICELDPAKPSEFTRAARGDVETIILKAMEKTRERRYQSVGQLADDVRHHLAGEPIEARPPTRWTRSHRWIGRHPILATGSLCVFLALAIGFGTWGGIWYLLQRPNAIVVDRANREFSPIVRALVTSEGGQTLKEWISREGFDPESQDGAIVFAHYRLLERPDDLGGGRLALVGFQRAWLDYPDYPNSLVAFDVDKSFTKPVFDLRVRPDDALPNLNDRTYIADEFGISFAAIHDVFPDVPGEEVVVVFKHYGWTQSILRIYDLIGNRLYEVWHDGYPESCHWMSGAGLLVFAGLDGSKSWGKLGYDVWNPADGSPFGNMHPAVVYAIRPQRGFIATDFLRSTAGDPIESGLNPVWYLAVPPVRGMIARASVSQPYDDPGSASVHVGLQLLAGSQRWSGPGLQLDETGSVTDRDDAGSLYDEKARTTPGGLPEEDQWTLIPYDELVANAGMTASQSGQ